MTGKTTLRTILALFLLSSCGGEAPSGAPAGEEDHEHGGGGAVTLWTDTVELFFEYPPMIAGEPSEPWAIHLTFLEDFQPVREGTLTLRFTSPDGDVHTTLAEAPAREGIFTPAPSLARPGMYRLTMTLESERRLETIPVGDIRVFASSEDLPHVDPQQTGVGIAFLKEQQWTIPFATAQAVEREVLRSFTANGEIVSPPNAIAHVTAPVDGLILARHNSNAPVPGDWVEAGTTLAVLSPVAEETAFAAQRAKVERLEREVARAERLVEVEAIPEKRLVEARHDLEVSRAALDAMGGSLDGSYELRLTTPLNGLVSQRRLTVGERVTAGSVLYTIVDPSALWLRVQVPAREASRISKTTAASFTVEGNPRLYETRRFVSVGAAIDPERRTLPVILEARNRDGSLKVGMLAEARLFGEETASGVAIPAQAVRKEDGLDVAYVQLGGESFERRVLALGPTDGEWTLVARGIRAGERVVIEGAYQVRLASLNASELADHGHPH